MIGWITDETFWLNVTNAGLGIVTLAALLTVVGAVTGDLLHRVRHGTESSVSADPHTYHLPDLGTTMADGGEKVAEEPEPEKKA